MNNASSLAEDVWDVAVIGAGVAGAVAAARCAERGLRTLLLERQRFPRFKVCGCCLNRRAIGMLEQSGIPFQGLDALGGSRTRALTIRCGKRRLDLKLPEGLAISRSALDQWLVDRAVAAGCRFQDRVAATVEPFDFEADLVGTRPRPRRIVQLDPRSNERTILLRPSSEKGGTFPEAVGRADADECTATLRTKARVVLACDGLGHPSLIKLARFKEKLRARSRIGLGATFWRSPGDIELPDGVIQMSVATFGYAGLVPTEGRQLNLAAAVDPAHLRKTRSARASLEAIFAASGTPLPRGLIDAPIRGTMPLTRYTTHVSGHRLFVLGDAAGYLEPFSGEGMAWAITAATAVTPLVVKALTVGWTSDLSGSWQHEFQAIVRREQRACRWLTFALHQPWLLSPLMVVARAVPPLADRLIRRINRLPLAQELNA